MIRADIVAEARKWVGVPYRNKGRDAHGLDCIGLLVVVGRALEVPHTDEPEYSNWPRSDLLIMRRLASFLTLVPPSTAKPGLIGLFAERTLPGHVGFFTEKHGHVHVIHARMRPALVIEEPWTHRGGMRLVALFAIPGLEDL